MAVSEYDDSHEDEESVRFLNCSLIDSLSFSCSEEYCFLGDDSLQELSGCEDDVGFSEGDCELVALRGLRI